MNNLTQLLSNNIDHLFQITFPVVIFVSMLIIGIYHKVIISSLKEKQETLKYRSDILQREADERGKLLERLQQNENRISSDNHSLTKALQDSLEAERRKERKIERLLHELNQIRITASNEILLSSFIVETLPRYEGGVILHDGKLALPALNASWKQLAKDNPGEPPYTDLCLWRRKTLVSPQSIEKTHRNVLKFNRKHPPHVWVTDDYNEGEKDTSIFPFILVSLISHEEADNLVTAVRSDVENIGRIFVEEVKTIAGNNRIKLGDGLKRNLNEGPWERTGITFPKSSQIRSLPN
jgi:hypothetical protein